MAEEDQKGRVVRLEIEDFKSYRGKEVIGPFKHFTTIIGPNGSGKSNLMDAISFVLGVKTGVLRGSNLRELLYVNTDSQDARDHPERGQVTLVFEAPDGEEVAFTRAIQRSSGDAYSSVYKLDGRIVSAEAYNQRLESYGILVRARNFLVFQGDIENVAQMSPKDLTAMFETISGSAALRREYEEAEIRAKEANSAMGVLFTRRKALAAEKRQKREQKEEAERHMNLMAELDQCKVKQALWQVFHIKEDIFEERTRAKALSVAASSAEETATAAEAAAEVQRRKQASLAKQRLLLEKESSKKRVEAGKRNPGLIKAKEQIAHAQRRLQAAEKEEETAKRKTAEHSAKITNLREQLAHLQDAHHQIESEIKDGQLKGRKSLGLDPTLLEEYNSIKRDVGAKTAQLHAERESLAVAAEADAEALRILKDAASSIDARIAELKSASKEDEAKLARANAAIEKSTAERTARLEERESLRGERRRVEARRSQLERRVEEAEGRLRDAKADSKQSAREEAQRALVDHLRTTFPRGVFGLVTDLAVTTHERYRLAMSVVMGKDFDAVIVDTPETAMQCIQVVKERRMPPMTFLPAATIKAKGVDPALRSLGGTARLAIDCLDIKDERCTRAFQAICGATLLCDGVPEARQLAFGGDQRHKVVALDGTAFLKNGIITGGITSAMEQRAKKWDAGEVGKLKEERSKVAGELAALPTMRDLTERLQAVEAAISRLDNTLHYATADQKATAQKISEAREAMAALQRERDTKSSPMTKLEKQIAERNRKVALLEKRIDEVADREFSAFSKKIGLASVREYEGKHLKEAERLAERRLAISAQIARVRNQLEYEEAANPGKEASRLGAEIAALKQQIQSLQNEARRFEAAAAEVNKALEQADAQEAELRSKLEEMDKESKEFKKAALAAADEAAAKRRSMAAIAARIEQWRQSVVDVLEAAELEGLTLPRLSGRRATEAITAARRRAAEHGLSDSEETTEDSNDEPMDLEDDVDGVDPSAASKPKKGSSKGRRKNPFDFSSLNGSDLTRGAADRGQWELEMKATIEETAAQLARMAPNLKALEQYEAVKGKEREQVEEVEAARREAKAAADAYESVRTRRLDLFNAALTHIAATIDPIYKELTRSALHPSGGQAYLSPENAEDPFSAGIKFSAMPPTKRFRDMEQLSGGEKTVAALALLFAVHSFHPSPFFVLDEVDAALDASNVAKVAAYMRAKTRPDVDGGFQGIVISLKDTFYEKADALVGVSRDPAVGSSSTLTFDLERFGPPMGTA